MIYPIAVTAALLAVWGTTAYMSVCGLVAAFGNHAVVTIILAAGLELAKLMVIVHLHAAWRRLRPGMRLFYITVIAALSALTAIETAGYLIDSHTRDTATITVDGSRLDGLAAQASALRHRIAVIDDTLAQLPEGYVSRRISERSAAGYDDLQRQLADNLAAQSELATALAEARASSSPIVTLAGLASVDPQRAAIGFALFIVAILEPLTIGLAVAASIAWSARPARHPQTAGRAAPMAAAAPVATATATAAPLATEKRPTTATPGNSEFAKIIARHNLQTQDIAHITGRKQLETVDAWLNGSQQIPVKALRLLRRWAANRPAVRLIKKGGAADG